MHINITHPAKESSAYRRAPAGDIHASCFKSACHNQFGFTLVEIMLTVAIIGILSTIAYSAYTQYIEEANNVTAISDIMLISQAIERFNVTNDGYPDDLSEINMDGYLDPWGNPYKYLRIAGANLHGLGRLRKDKSLVPINSDYDLYSMGKDGASVPPFTARASHDDIVRANNGGYVGLADDY